MWCCLFWCCAICAGVGAGVGIHLNNANDTKEMFKNQVTDSGKLFEQLNSIEIKFLIHKKDDGAKEIKHPMFEPIQKKGPAFENGKLKKGGPGNNRKVSVEK